jgi:hypothetical protein
MPYRPLGKSRVGGLFPVGDQWPDPPADAGPPTEGGAPSGRRPMVIGAMRHRSVPAAMRTPSRRRGLTGPDVAVLLPICLLALIVLVAIVVAV